MNKDKWLKCWPIKAANQEVILFLFLYFFCHQSNSEGAGLHWISKGKVGAVVKDSLVWVPISPCPEKLRHFYSNFSQYTRGRSLVAAVRRNMEIMVGRHQSTASWQLTGVSCWLLFTVVKPKCQCWTCPPSLSPVKSLEKT